MFGDWTDRIAAGELPADEAAAAAGRRAQRRHHGVGLGRPQDLPPRRDRDRQAQSHGQRQRAALRRARGQHRHRADPRSGARTPPRPVKMPVRDPKTPSSTAPTPMFAPSPYWGDEKHLGQPDHRRTTRCSMRRGGSGSRPASAAPTIPTSARRAPTIRRRSCSRSSSRTAQLAMYDPKTEKFTLIDTCFPTHHLQFGFDKRPHAVDQRGRHRRRRASAGSTRKMFEETGDEAKSQGWTPFILDTNGNGKRDEGYVEPNQPVDPTKDKRIRGGFYGIAPNPGRRLDLGLGDSAIPGSVVRVDPGANPPATALAEIYEVPLPGYSPRGMDIDSKGVVWARARERPSRQLRSPQVQGPAQRSERDRQALPGGLDALSVAGTAVRQRRRGRQRRNAATTPGSTSTTRSGWARTCRSPPATRTTR